MVVARVWRGRTPKSKRKRYLGYLRKTGVRDYRSTPGNLSVTILVRDVGDESEFVIITLWKSMDAIRKFAGEDVEKAKYYPKDREFLLELEPRVEHYDLGLKSE